ncbi:MAG TPA: hypothetical protein PKX56_02730 [Marmoricola sp.]|nr:hypothetical protein [Marmoricola sp.]
MSNYVAGKTVVLQKIGDLATDEINLQLISDIHELVGSQGTQTLLDRAVAASERVDLDLERLITHLDFFLSKAEDHLQAAGYTLEWGSDNYTISKTEAKRSWENS